MSCQSRFDARYWMLGAGALGRPRGMEWGGRRDTYCNADLPLLTTMKERLHAMTKIQCLLCRPLREEEEIGAQVTP